MGALEALVRIVTGAEREIGREHAVLRAAEGVIVNDFGGGPDGAGHRGPAYEPLFEIRAAGGETTAGGRCGTMTSRTARGAWPVRGLAAVAPQLLDGWRELASAVTVMEDTCLGQQQPIRPRDVGGIERVKTVADLEASEAPLGNISEPGGTRELRIAVIGAGMAGVLAAVKLKELGIDFVVYEKGDRIGGTWRDNHYPGLACDVPSVVYSYSFEMYPEWSRRYAPGPEIREYFEAVAERRGVMPFFRFSDEVTSCEWIDGRWHLETTSGHTDSADVVIAATGVLHHPNVPKFDGIETFQGDVLHSARWDDGVSLDGRRIGVIGTGSTAVQITSALVDRVHHYSLFQRTAQWVMLEPNFDIAEDKKQTFRDDPAKMTHLHHYLAKKFRDYLVPGFLDVESERMSEVQARCEQDLATVRDEQLRAKLTPSYRAGCKRLVVSPDFYEKIQRPNVNVVTEGIERFEPRGIRTRDGLLHELDVIVLATGFRPDRFVRPIRLLGRDGIDLDDVWAGGPVAYLSIAVPGFPNLFMLNGPNGPIGNLSLIKVAERQLAYVLHLVDGLREGRHKEIAVTRAATDRFEAERIAAAKGTVWASGCNSWYLDQNGVPATWTFSYDRFIEDMRAPEFAAYE